MLTLRQVIPKSPLDYRFDKDSTYVITGGLGGIGRSLALWMTELGARHLVLLSRSGVKSDAAKELVAKLKTDGVDVYAPVCDISNEEHVKKAAAHVQATMPPIKGCIHGALVVIVSFPAVKLRHHHQTNTPPFPRTISSETSRTENSKTPSTQN